MNPQILTQVSVAAVVTVAVWLYGAYQHNIVAPDSTHALRVPWAVAMLFGKVGGNGILDLSGVVLQIFVCVMTPTLVLVSLGTILPIIGLLIFVGLVFLDLGIVLYHEYARRRER